MAILARSWIAIGTGALSGKAHDAPPRVERFPKRGASPQIPPALADPFQPHDSPYRQIGSRSVNDEHSPRNLRDFAAFYSHCGQLRVQFDSALAAPRNRLSAWYGDVSHGRTWPGNCGFAREFGNGSKLRRHYFKSSLISEGGNIFSCPIAHTPGAEHTWGARPRRNRHGICCGRSRPCLTGRESGGNVVVCSV